MEPHRDDTDLALELRALRPTPAPEFAADLDARAAAGFPRGDSQRGTPLHRFLERLRGTPPRRLLVPAGAVAVFAVAISTAVVAVQEGEQGAPTAGSRSPVEGEPTAGRLSVVPQAEYESSAGSATSKSGPYASRAGQREIERAAQIVLGTDPADVRGDAAKVFDAVHAANGIVLRSSIRDGSAGEAGAEFELLIPSARLSDALADFSGITEVRSRRESTQDITAPTIGTREHLEDSQAKIDGLLAQLAAASTEGERTAVEAELRAERRRSAFLRSRLATLSRRANLSRVSLRIETGAGAANEGGGGAWGVGDGLDDAGRILEIAAGVTIVGLAILAPLALIALLAWLAHRAWVQRARARSLGQAT